MEMCDLDQVVQIDKDCYDYPWTKGIFNDCIKVGYFCHVLEVDHSIIGFVLMLPVLDEIHLLNICVAKAWQGKGWGQCLLDYVKKIAQTAHAKKIYLEVRVSNEVAKQLYLKNGFEEIGRRVNYYREKNGKEDAIVYAKKI